MDDACRMIGWGGQIVFRSQVSAIGYLVGYSGSGPGPGPDSRTCACTRTCSRDL